MTRDEAAAIWLNTGLRTLATEFRANLVRADEMLEVYARDEIDGLVALGVLKLENDAP